MHTHMGAQRKRSHMDGGDLCDSADDDDGHLALSLGSIYSAASAPSLPCKSSRLSNATAPPPSQPPSIPYMPLESRATSQVVPAPTPSMPSLPLEIQQPQRHPSAVAAAPRSTRRRLNISSTRNGGVLESPPFPWATNRAAKHSTLADLSSRGITTIEGEVQCKRCNSTKTISYDLQARFVEVADYIKANRHVMNDRAPSAWMSPTFPDCEEEECSQKNCMRPVMPSDKNKINWLFLLLGQTLGHCTLDQLKYFCMHTNNHRTGAKDRLLYYTYLELCKQLQPEGPFDVPSCNGRKLHYSSMDALAFM